jgi:hypothetical protein
LSAEAEEGRSPSLIAGVLLIGTGILLVTAEPGVVAQSLSPAFSFAKKVVECGTADTGGRRSA